MSTNESGGVVLHVDLDVTTEEMRRWPMDRICAFFEGITKVRTAVHDGEDIERLRAEWRDAQDDSRHLERCLEEIARTVGIDPDDGAYDGELWASKLTTDIVKRITIGQESTTP
jgi:hypothetical protein